MNAWDILEQAKQLGVELRVKQGYICYRPKSVAPTEFVEALRSHKAELLQVLKHGQAPKSEFDCWVLQEWRRVSIPQWRRILQESIEKHDRHREEYARWMLREVLLDPEYEEPAP